VVPDSPAGGGTDGIDVVLVPLDGSPFAETALPVAARLAQRLNAAIHLLSAVAGEDEVSKRAAELQAIDQARVRVEREVVVDLDPAGAIHEALRRLGRAVACMASHGRGRSAALWGSVANDVMARGHDPLILVGPLVDPKLAGDGIVACVDDAPEAQRLLPVALRWADLLREPLTVITVAEPAPEPVRAGPVRRLFGPDGDVGRYLDALVDPVRDGRRDVATAAVYDPIGVVDGVCSYIEEHPAALVVVGSHAREGLARVAHGSIAAGIVYRGPCPVLVVCRGDTT
jgi:nucleotide-binding universal stress UspA family protein